MSDNTEPTPAVSADSASPAPQRRKLSVPSLIIGGVFGLFYAYLVWTAVGNAINFPPLFSAIGHPDAVPTWLLAIGIAIPVVVYVLAFLLGLRHSILIKAVVFIMGLTAAAALGYGVIALGSYIFSTLTPIAIAG